MSFRTSEDPAEELRMDGSVGWKKGVCRRQAECELPAGGLCQLTSAT